MYRLGPNQYFGGSGGGGGGGGGEVKVNSPYFFRLYKFLDLA